jgi:hypothetical protein
MAILGFVLGLILAPLLFFFCYVVFVAVTGYEDFEGATAMGLATFVLPLVAMIGGIGGAILLPRLTARH